MSVFVYLIKVSDIFFVQAGAFYWCLFISSMRPTCIICVLACSLHLVGVRSLIKVSDIFFVLAGEFFRVRLPYQCA